MSDARQQVQGLLAAARVLLEQACEIAEANGLQFTFGTDAYYNADYRSIPDEIEVEWQPQRFVLKENR
jgi:hypothetical protein